MVIVSPHFPPSSLAGAHRARHLARHLPAAGWRPTILCVDERFHSEALDPALGRRVPADIEIIKARALPKDLARRFGIGDISLRGGLQLRRELLTLLKTRRIDAVLITGMPFYPMLNAAAVARRLGVPVVLDFQDPWVSAWGAAQEPLSKAGLTHLLATRLEPLAVRHAAFVTSVSDIQNDQMAARYPWLDRERMAAIPIGGDPDDFDAAAQTDGSATAGALSPGKINLSYVGAYWPRAEKPVRQLMKAIAHLRDHHPALADRLRFNFVGTVTGGDPEIRPVSEIARSEGVGPFTHEIPERLPFLEALALMRRSDGLVLIGSDEPHYTASKIYPALMSGTPFLSLFHAQSSAHAILTSAGGGLALAFADEPELNALAPQLADGLRRLAETPKAMGRADPAAYASYTAASVAARFGAIFDRVADERRRGR